MMAVKKKDGYGEQIPPALRHVIIYFDQKGSSSESAKEFFGHYKSRGWKTEKGCPIKNWKALANNWIWKEKQQQKSLVITIRLHI
jgi:hypothetical protein